ncbi:MAG TPA: hypothetical protein VM260_11205, partial [Pirellula sp.]|nr:hypothetical protein [Pirellula sp.]
MLHTKAYSNSSVVSSAGERVQSQFLLFPFSFSLFAEPFMPDQIDTAHLTRLGNSDLYVSRVGLGCWPMSGISSLGVTDELSTAT